MNNYTYSNNTFSAAAARSADMRGTVVCPKPRRAGLGHAAIDAPRARAPMRRYTSLEQEEASDSKAGNELLDLIRYKGGCGPDQLSSPPFFSGSPPGRVSNPLIQDVRFGDENFSPNGPGCIRSNFDNTPTVRVEGFDCLDTCNCNIPTFA